MRTILKYLIAVVLFLGVLVVVVGPGKIVAGAEYPFGIGPWSNTGRYCHQMYDATRFVDKWNRTDQSFTTSDHVTLGAYEKTLTETGPHVPRADFTAFFRTTGKKVAQRMTSEGELLNTWWKQNCDDPLMEAPASANNTMAGLISHVTFTHYPKNVVNVQYFMNVLAH